MQKYYEFRDRKLVESADTNSPVLVCTSPDSDDMALLTNRFNIDPHNIQSAVDPDELTRVEFEPDHTVMILKRPKNYSSQDNFLFKVASLGMFFFKDRLVIITTEDTGLFDAKHPMALESPSDALLRVIAGVIMHFIGHLKVINMISDELEHKVNTSMENRYLLGMFSLEKSLVYYLSATHYNAAVIDKIRANSSRMGFSQDTIEYLDDLAIENSQCAKQAEIYSNILASLMDARASLVNNNLNILLKQLTIISIVFLPLNLIASIGGMSEYSFMTKSLPWQVSYALFMAGMVIIGFLTYMLLNKSGNKGLKQDESA